MRFSAFTPFGHFRFSGRKPVAQAIYESMRDAQGDAYATDWGSIQQSRLYAASMCLGSAQLQLDRAQNNAVMMKATEMVPALEHDYQIKPGGNATLAQRRIRLSAARKLLLGNAMQYVKTELEQLLGDQFLGIRVEVDDTAPRWPSFPDLSGIWTDYSVPPALFELVGPVCFTLTIETVLTVRMLQGTQFPPVGAEIMVDVGHLGSQEKVTVTRSQSVGVDGYWSIGAVYTRPHDYNTPCWFGPFPYWASAQRHTYIVVGSTAWADGVLMAELEWYLKRALKGVSTWTVCRTSTATTIGPFMIGTSQIGETPILQLMYTPES